MGTMKKRANKPTKKFKPSVLIYCDGESEKNYVNSLRQDKYVSMRIQIKPGLGACDKFETVLDEIEELLLNKDVDDQYSRILYLKDMDTIYSQDKIHKYRKRKDHLLHLKSAKNRLFFIESRPCFEFWFLLHYESRDRLLNNCSEVETDLCKHLADYCKENKYTEKIYEKLKRNLDTAISNSKAICDRSREPGAEYSYTLIHKAIEELDRLSNP